MNGFLKTYEIPKLNKDIKMLNNPIIGNEIGAIIIIFLKTYQLRKA